MPLETLASGVSVAAGKAHAHLPQALRARESWRTTTSEAQHLEAFPAATHQIHRTERMHMLPPVLLFFLLRRQAEASCARMPEYTRINLMSFVLSIKGAILKAIGPLVNWIPLRPYGTQYVGAS